MTNDPLSARLIKARSAMGWSQSDLAEASGISPTQISRYESGMNHPRPQAVAKLAAALGLPFEWLSNGDQEPPGTGTTLELSPRADGGADVSLRLDDETAGQLAARASELGISIEDLAKALMLEGLGKRGAANKSLPEVDIEYLAQRVKELLAKDKAG
jgi:transcriptional regulator with XRE-family HTH domain